MAAIQAARQRMSIVPPLRVCSTPMARMLSHRHGHAPAQTATLTDARNKETAVYVHFNKMAELSPPGLFGIVPA